MNKDRTLPNSDTSLTQPGSGPVLYELVDKDGNVVASFTPPCVAQMAEFARHRWPDQEQDEDRTGKGWDIQVVGAR